MRIRIGSTNLAEVDGFRFILFCNLGVPAHVLFLPWPAMMIICSEAVHKEKSNLQITGFPVFWRESCNRFLQDFGDDDKKTCIIINCNR